METILPTELSVGSWPSRARLVVVAFLLPIMSAGCMAEDDPLPCYSTDADPENCPPGCIAVLAERFDERGCLGPEEPIACTLGGVRTADAGCVRRTSDGAEFYVSGGYSSFLRVDGPETSWELVPRPGWEDRCTHVNNCPSHPPP